VLGFTGLGEGWHQENGLLKKCSDHLSASSKGKRAFDGLTLTSSFLFS